MTIAPASPLPLPTAMGRMFVHLVALLVCTGYFASAFKFYHTSNAYRAQKTFSGQHVDRLAFIPNRNFNAILKASDSSSGANSDISDQVKGAPDRSKFNAFFAKTVTRGSEIKLNQLILYEEIGVLLNDGLVLAEDVTNLWTSAVGDAKGLTVDEAYELLCMISDLPDPDDVAWMDKEFEKLTTGKGSLAFFKFVSWGDVQDMMNNDIITMEEVSDIWRKTAGDLNTSIDRKMFGKVNAMLDEKIDQFEKVDGSDDNDNDDDDIIDLSGVNIWEEAFKPLSVFDDESIQEMNAFFEDSSVKGLLSKSTFVSWSYIQDVLADGSLSLSDIANAWSEAITGTGNEEIDYDRFIRLNVKLDMMMDQAESAASTPAKPSNSKVSTDQGDKDDAEAFYRREFKKVTQGSPLMRLDMLLEWSEIKELLADKVVTAKQIEKMFDGLPKEPMGIPATAFGIAENTFVAFNGMLDVLLDAAGGSSASATSTRTTPSILVSEPARPMPKMSEMKLGSLGTADGDDEPEMSESEMELMSILDKADNMLNSGSFGDFDQLIGDMNDPRLQALREKRDGAEEVRGELREVIKDLLKLTRQQKRCGLDKPAEEDQARIRDLVQGVIEKAPKAYLKDISKVRSELNGKWKLLYTNSEMFDFYNGVTGFANVFPASKFEDLSVQYTSDGYLSESKYFEKLKTPLGDVDATVFSNWELLKEMSFMTNDNSLVLRNFCQKVTAGPMEYLAEENWKSLRTMSMNELVYIDENIKIMRNCGALRIYFVYERI